MKDTIYIHRTTGTQVRVKEVIKTNGSTTIVYQGGSNTGRLGKNQFLKKFVYLRGIRV